MFAVLGLLLPLALCSVWSNSIKLLDIWSVLTNIKIWTTSRRSWVLSSLGVMSAILDFYFRFWVGQYEEVFLRVAGSRKCVYICWDRVAIFYAWNHDGILIDLGTQKCGYSRRDYVAIYNISWDKLWCFWLVNWVGPVRTQSNFEYSAIIKPWILMNIKLQSSILTFQEFSLPCALHI